MEISAEVTCLPPMNYGGFVRRRNTHLCKELPYCAYAVIPNPLYPGVRDLLGAAGVKEILREYAQDDILAGLHESTVRRLGAFHFRGDPPCFSGRIVSTR